MPANAGNLSISSKEYPNLSKMTPQPKDEAHSFSALMPGPSSPDPFNPWQGISFELEPKPIENFPFLQTPVQTLSELEEFVIAKGPPGQWFRKIPGKKTDITCLPAEMHAEILKNVSFLDQLVCERVCSTWRTIIRRDCAGFRYTTIDDSQFTGIKKPQPQKNTESSRAGRPVISNAIQPQSEKPQILIHRLLQDGNFAFRQIPGTQSSVELMSTYFPAHPHEKPRRFKVANLSFLNDPIAIYTNTNFRRREEIPTITIEFDPEPLRNEFLIKIGGSFTSANTVHPILPALPLPFPGLPITPTHLNRTLSSSSARIAFCKHIQYCRPWDLGTFLLALMGKLESDHHWFENTSPEQNERWNGRNWDTKWKTGVDYDGDWDMDNGFRKPLTISEIIAKERALLAQYQLRGYWYMREWRKDTKIDRMHVSLTPVSEWVWEICY